MICCCNDVIYNADYIINCDTESSCTFYNYPWFIDKKLMLHRYLVSLTLSQMTNFRLFQTERVCRRQFSICRQHFKI